VTPPRLAQPEAGIDLPLKGLVSEAGPGAVAVAFDAGTYIIIARPALPAALATNLGADRRRRAMMRVDAATPSRATGTDARRADSTCRRRFRSATSANAAMNFALLLAIGVAVCVPIQLLVPRYWFALFVSVVATLLAWALASLPYAAATAHPLVGTGEWSTVEAVLAAALIAQVVAIFLKRFR
jgi:hypothetical protein